MQKQNNLKSKRDAFLFDIRKKQRRNIIDQRRKQILGSFLSQSSLAQSIKYIQITQIGRKLIFKDPQMASWIIQSQKDIDINNQKQVQQHWNKFFKKIQSHFDILTIFTFLQNNLLEPLTRIKSIQAQKAHEDFWYYMIKFLQEKASYIKQAFSNLIQNFHQHILVELQQKAYIDFLQKLQGLCNFLFQFMKKNRNSHLGKLQKLNRQILSVMQILTDHFDNHTQNIKTTILRQNQQPIILNFDIKQLRRTILQWIQCADNLNLIKNCLTATPFLPVKFHKRIYQIIDIGFNSNIRYLQLTAGQILQKIMQKAQYMDDACSIHQVHPNLMISLITQSTKIIQNSYGIAQKKISQNDPRSKNRNSLIEGNIINNGQNNYEKNNDDHDILTLRSFCTCIKYLLDTYDSTVQDYLHQGVGSLSAEMIYITCQPEYKSYYGQKTCNENIIHAMDIFRMLSMTATSQQRRYYQSATRFLLTDKDIINYNFWDIISGNGHKIGYDGPHFFFHDNPKIKYMTFRFIQNLLAGGQLDDKAILFQKMQFQNMLSIKLQNKKEQLRDQNTSQSNQQFYHHVIIQSYQNNYHEETTIKENSETRNKMQQQEIPKHLINKVKKFDLMDIFSVVLKNFENQEQIILSSILTSLKSLIFYSHQQLQFKRQMISEFENLNKNSYQNFNQIVLRIQQMGLIQLIQTIKNKYQRLQGDVQDIMNMIDLQKRSSN